MSRFRYGLSVVAIALVAACATTGTKNVMTPSSAFTDADGALFDDGVDMIGYPKGLSGRWAEDWITELRARVDRSDLIAQATITTLRTDVSPEQRSTHWLVADVSDPLKGLYQGELSLAASAGELGYESVERNRGNLLGADQQALILFAKWVRDEAGVVHARWHLVRAAEDLVKALRTQVERSQPAKRSTATRTTIEHTQ